MKKIGFLILFACLSQITFSQNADFRSVISFNLGASAFGFLPSDLGANAKPGEVEYKYGKLSNTPTFQLGYDYGFVKWFSAGLAGSYNNAKYTYSDVQYKGQNLGAISLIANRTTISLRLLFHYANNNNWDLYSGGRIGVGIWSGKISLDANDDLAKDLLAKVDENLQNFVPKFIRKRLLNNVGASAGFVAPQFQFIPIGVRGYINDHVGLNAELALGSPYYLSGGVTYRF